MHAPLDSSALAQLFTEARSVHSFTDRPVTESTLRELYDLMRWGPTAFNCQPARYVFVQSAAAKARLAPAMSGSNRDKTVAAPVTAIVAIDYRFFEHLDTQWPKPGAREMQQDNPLLAAETAQRNGTLQGAYLVLAARALGLAAGPMSGFDPQRVDAEFFADGRYRTNFLCNLGWQDDAPVRPRGPRLVFEQVAQLV